MKTTIHTLKKEYKDNQTYLNEKQNLFQNLTYMMIEKELNHNDIDIKHEEPLKEELRSFLNAVVNGTEPEITGEDGLKALKMVIAATKSSREHKPISFDEIE